MLVINNILSYLEDKLPSKDGKYSPNKDIVTYVKREDKLEVNFLYAKNEGSINPTIIGNIVDDIDKIVGSKHIYEKTYTFTEGVGIRVIIQYRYKDINDRVTRPSMRTLLGLSL